MTHGLRLAGLLSSIALLMAIVLSAEAQETLVHLPLDGSVENRGRAGPARLITPDGADAPTYVEGHSGQALSFGKGGAVVIPYAFNPEETPRATMTMWVRVEAESNYERELLSLGPGSGLLLTISSDRMVNVRSDRRASHTNSFPLGEWVFVAATIDNNAGSISIWQNEDVREFKALKIRTPSSLAVTAPGTDKRERFIFIGADDFNSAGREVRPVMLDDVRLYPDALSPAEIRTIRDGLQPATTDGSEPIVSREVTTDLPKDIHRPLPDATIDEEGDADIGETEKNLSTVPAARMPDAGLTIPDGLPGEDILNDIEELPDEPAPPEPMDEILCKGEPVGNPVHSSNGGNFPAEFQAALAQVERCGERATVAALNASGQWIVATGREIAHSRNLPQDLVSALEDFEEDYGGLHAGDISDTGNWLIVNGRNYVESGLPSSAKAKLDHLLQTAGGVASFDFAPGGSGKWAMVSLSGNVIGESLSPLLTNAMEDMASSKRRARHVRFGPSGELVLLADGLWFVTENAHRLTLDALRKEQLRGKQVDLLVFSDTPGQYVTYASDEAERYSDPIYDFEHGFQATNNVGSSVPATIWSRMEANNLKAMSIAMVRNNRIVWTRGYGLLNADEAESYVYTDSTFDIASLSKPLAAFGLLQLVDEGKLSLTDDGIMDDAEALMSSSQKSTFRTNVDPSDGNLIQLLQHCAGICYNNGCGGSAEEYALNTNLPSTADMIVGTGNAAKAKRLRRARSAGLGSVYTSANFMMVQALIDVHGGGFLAHMKPLLDELEMVHSTYKSPYALRGDGNFARGWEEGQVADIVAYGEMAGASLVSTPSEYAKFIIAVNKLAEGQANDDLMSLDTFNKYLGRDTSIYNSADYGTCANPGSYALGIRHLNRGSNWGGIEYYWHTGSHNGYRARMDGFPALKGGVVVFMTGGRDDADAFLTEVQTSLRAAYDLTRP